MSKKFSIQIPKPCSEDWEQMTPDQKGRFCTLCQTSIIDFSKMSQSEIIAFFKNPPKKVCGRFQSHQLKTYHIENPKSSFLSRFFALFFGFQVVSISPILAQNPLQSQQTQSIEKENMPISTELVFQGQVLDSLDNSEIHSALIKIKGTNIGIEADEHGNFSLALKPQYFKKDKLTVIISFIGYENKEIILEKDVIEVIKYKILLQKDKTFSWDVNGKALIKERVITGGTIIVIRNESLWDRFRNWWRNR